jgi:hypothetical protein
VFREVVLKVEKMVQEMFELVKFADFYAVSELVKEFDEGSKPLDGGFDFGLEVSWNMAIPCILFRFSLIFTPFIEPSRGLSCLCSVKAPFSASHHVCASFLLLDAY